MSSPANQPAPGAGTTTTPKTFPAKAYGAASATSAIAPLSIKRRSPGPQDVQIEILYCGVCHSDLHQVRNEWQSALPTVYPCVPGHEIVGRVVAVGRYGQEVQDGRPRRRRLHGRLVPHLPELPGGPRAVLRDAADLHLQHRPTSTSAASPTAATPSSIVVDEAFVLRVPDKLSPAAAAPLLCAGITTYSPLRHWKVGKGHEGRHRRPRRARAHGREVRARLRRARGPVHDLARQDRGRQAAGRGRGRRLEGRRAR